MLITHAMNGPKIIKAQTPNRKIKHIVTNKNQLLNNPLNKIPSNKKLSLNNKQNENPNIKKSPSQQKDKPTIHLQHNQRVKQNRVKSQYYSSAISTTKQSPIKKILFVKNLCYKSTKTSKNSSLDNKNQQPTSTASQQKYLSLNHNSQRSNPFDKETFERKSHSNGNNKKFMENESQIHTQEKVNDRNIQQFRAKDSNMLQHTDSQASYKMTMIPNELHAKMAQFNQKYASYQNQNTQYNKPNLNKMNNFDCSNTSSQNIYPKHHIINNNKMCPNIQSSNLSELESFKKNNFIFSQQKKQTIKALISVDKDKKESLSSKKRNSRIKINYKNSDKFKQSFNEDLGTEQSEIMISSPSHPIFDQKIKLNNSTNFESERDSKSSMSKNVCDQQSTLIQTKKITEGSLINMSNQFSKITLNESNQYILPGSNEKNMDYKRYCLNHPEKQAKYKMDKNIQNPFYCKKCAVLMVTQGHQVIDQLQPNQNKRMQKLKSFIAQLQQIQPKFSKSKTEIGFLQQQVNIIIKKGHQEIQKYYKKLHETLNSHKQNAIKALNFYSQKTILELSMLKKKLNQNENEFNFMKRDILPNFDLIVDENKLPDKSFQLIIKEHEVKLKNIDCLILNISNLAEAKQNKLSVKTVQIPMNELKSTLNVLQRTQIVFIDKIVKINLKELLANHYNVSIEPQNEIFTDAKKDFSFDDQNIDTSFYVPSSQKKNRMVQSPSVVQNIYELTDSIRLSFGTRFETSPSPIKSPTFKMI